MSRAPSYCGVILAAGSSSRMGRDKALLPWPADSTKGTFLSGAMDTLIAITDLVIVIAGENEPALRSAVYSRAGFLLTNPEPSRGQFSSLRIGLQAVLDHGRDGAVVMLVDRPPVKLDTVKLLVQTLNDALEEGVWAVAPQFQGKHGHPLVLGRELIEAMLRAPAESTAKQVREANASHVRYLEVEDANVVLNVNTPEEYARASQNLPGESAH